MTQGSSRNEILSAFLKMALDHDARDTSVACSNLLCHFAGHRDLALVLFAAVGMRYIDHNLFTQSGRAQQGASGIDIGRGVVGDFATAQDHMAVIISTRLEDRSLAHLGHAHKGVCCARRLDGVGGDLDAAIGAVFEANRAGQTTGELAMALALRRTRPNGAPTDQIADELRTQQIQELGGHWQAQHENVEQQAARHLQALIDGKTVIEVRVVDVPLPADGSAGLLEIHPHYDEQIVLKKRRLLLQLPGILHRLVMVVDGAGPNYHDQTVIVAMQNLRDGLAAALHQNLCSIGYGPAFFQQCGSDQGTYRADAGVIDAGCIVGG